MWVMCISSTIGSTDPFPQSNCTIIIFPHPQICLALDHIHSRGILHRGECCASNHMMLDVLATCTVVVRQLLLAYPG